MAGVDLRAPFAFEHRDAAAFEREQVRSGQTRDAAADDRDVDGFVAIELGKLRQRGRVNPVRQSIDVHFHSRCLDQ
jgi:hypothetical protein